MYPLWIVLGRRNILITRVRTCNVMTYNNNKIMLCRSNKHFLFGGSGGCGGGGGVCRVSSRIFCLEGKIVCCMLIF